MLYFIFCFIFLINIFFNVDLFLKEPPVWPDEAIYADVAKNIIEKNRFATDLWKGLLPGVENGVYWYPPVFFYSVAFWMNVFGISITSQRILSLVIAAAILVIFYLLSRIILKKEGSDFKKINWIALLGITALSQDLLFLKAAKVSRPETLILLFGLLSAYLLLRKNSSKSFSYIAAGFFASLSFLTHMIGIFVFLSLVFFQLLTGSLQIFRSKNFYLFFIFVTVPLVIWIISIYPNLLTFKEQVLPGIGQKSVEEPWLFSELRNQNIPHKMIYLFYIFISVFFFVYSVFKRTRENILVSVFLFFAWFFALFGRMGWYLIFPIPFIYLSLIILLFQFYLNFITSKTIVSRNIFWGCLILILSFILLNIGIRFNSYRSYFGDNYSYSKYTASIIQKIPFGTTVFLSAIPDPYYAFLKDYDQYKIFEFPPGGNSLQKYTDVLNQADYIVYNSHYDYLSFGNFLPAYIEKNIEEIIKVGGINQYQTFIIKLKPVNEREIPEEVGQLYFK